MCLPILPLLAQILPESARIDLHGTIYQLFPAKYVITDIENETDSDDLVAWQYVYANLSMWNETLEIWDLVEIDSMVAMANDYQFMDAMLIPIGKTGEDLANIYSNPILGYDEVWYMGALKKIR